MGGSMMFWRQNPLMQVPVPERHDPPLSFVLMHRFVKESQVSLVHSLLSLHCELKSQNRCTQVPSIQSPRTKRLSNWL